MLIQEKHIRKLLGSYSSKGFFDNESHALLLLELLRYNPVIHSFVVRCEAKFGSREQLPQGIRTLLSCFSTTSPVSSYFPASSVFSKIVDRLIDGLAIKKDPLMLSALQKLAPVVFDAIVALPDDRPLENSWRALLEVLKKTHFLVFPQRLPHNLPSPVENVQENNSKFFPNWPQLCMRGNYVLDKGNKEEDACSKKGAGHPKLLPGIFTVYCKHGKFDLTIIVYQYINCMSPT